MKRHLGAFCLSPAYDLVSTHLVIKDSEEMCLTINGKKSKNFRKDFDILGANLKLTEKQIENIY